MTKHDPGKLFTPFLTAIEAGEVLELSERTLDRYRQIGKGPAYYKFGNQVRYRLTDLIAWRTKQRA